MPETVRLSVALAELVGDRNLAFYDAISSIVASESIDWGATFRGGRHRPEEQDYVNAPLTETESREFVRILVESPADDFQPMSANFGLVPPLPRRVRPEAARRDALAPGALESLKRWMAVHGITPVEAIPSTI